MKLDFLKISDWRNLRNFEIDFDQKEPMVVILGQNGSGKSNLIQALVHILRELDEGRSAEFPFELGYFVTIDARQRHVIVVGNGDREAFPQVTVDDEPVRAGEWKQARDNILPTFVFAYYSGSNNRLEAEFVQPLREHYRRWFEHASTSETVPVRRFFYSRREYATLVILAFFLSEDPHSLRILRDYLHIDGFDSALMTLRKPWWAGTKPSRVALREGDPRFWYARGAFTPFLERLWLQSLAPFKVTGRKELDFRGRSEDVERAYLYIKDTDRLRELKWPGESAFKIFAFLEALELCGLLDLDATKVKVKHRSGKTISFDQLSEGEQQLLMVLGLMVLNRREESLFLLDEPDTHLNPQWTYRYFELVKQCFSEDTSHLLIATHNPLMIGSLRATQVRVLTPRRSSIADAEATAVTAGKQPSVDPIGLGVDGLLQSELFGLESVLPQQILDDIHERQMLLAKEVKSAEDETRIRELSDSLAGLGVARTFPHPYFNAFANALARSMEYRRAKLSRLPVTELRAIEEEAFASLEAQDHLATTYATTSGTTVALGVEHALVSTAESGRTVLPILPIQSTKEEE